MIGLGWIRVGWMVSWSDDFMVWIWWLNDLIGWLDDWMSALFEIWLHSGSLEGEIQHVYGGFTYKRGSCLASRSVDRAHDIAWLGEMQKVRSWIHHDFAGQETCFLSYASHPARRASNLPGSEMWRDAMTQWWMIFAARIYKVWFDFWWANKWANRLANRWANSSLTCIHSMPCKALNKAMPSDSKNCCANVKAAVIHVDSYPGCVHSRYRLLDRRIPVWISHEWLLLVNQITSQWLLLKLTING